MNFYVDLMQQVINHVEENICENITLTSISRKFSLSEYHFDRLFNAVVGTSLKQYVLGRKLSLAIDKLKYTNDSIIDVAMSCGFEYPEVFSRAFKKQFGVSPRECRISNPKLDIVEKIEIVPREIVNYMGGVTLKASYSYLEPVKLAGVAADVDITDSNYGFELKTESEKFLVKSAGLSGLDHERLYSAVNCHGDEENKYTVFSGKRIINENFAGDFKQRELPGGWYAGFVYTGDMVEIRSTFVDDLFKWIAKKGIELSSNGVGMISVFNKDYSETQKVDILVPVKSPK